MDERLWGLFRQAKKVRRLDSQTVTRDKMDDHVFDEMTERAELFRSAVERAPQIEGDDDKDRAYVPHWDDLMHDLFVSYHTIENPSVLPTEAVKPSRETNRRIMQQIIGTNEHSTTRAMTKHDPVSSAFAAMAGSEKATELLKGSMREQAQKAQEAGRQEDKIESAQDAIEQVRQEIAEQDSPATDEQKAAMAKAAKRKSNASQELAKLAAQMQDAQMTAQQAVEIAGAAKEAKDAAEIMANLPGIGKGGKDASGKRLSPDEAIRLAQMFRDNPILAEVAKMLGRMLRDMRFKRARRITGGVEEVVDITLGDDLERLLVNELMKLKHPMLRRVFFRDYHEKALMQYELRGTEEVGFGPLIVVRDSSSSMKGKKQVWAAAVSLALIAIAHREKRDAYVIDYSDSFTSWEFPHKAALDSNKIVEMTSHFFGHGTETDRALGEAERIVNKAAKFDRADIILLSDGQDTWANESQRLRESFEAMGVRMHGVQIGADIARYVDEMCDVTVSAYDLAGANKATDMLATAVS